MLQEASFRSFMTLQGFRMSLFLLSLSMPPFPKKPESTMQEITWEKLALLHFHDFDSSQLHTEPRLRKVLNGFPSIGALRQGWRLAGMTPYPLLFVCSAISMMNILPLANIPPRSMCLLTTWYCPLPIGGTTLSLTDLPFVVDFFARLLLRLSSPAGVLLHLRLTRTKVLTCAVPLFVLIYEIC